MKFEEKSFSSGETMFSGAIFMCNRKTKKECLWRGLFGLPSSQEGVVRSIKCGMILFLFEYEERTLHGVFQATSEGALNIVPTAFRSSGKTFSAQIHFKRIWNCLPLKENEFRSAIFDNYYNRKKFSLGLSHKQVLGLLSLFDPRRIRVPKVQGSVVLMPPREMETGFQNPSVDGSNTTKHHESINSREQLSVSNVFSYHPSGKSVARNDVPLYSTPKHASCTPWVNRQYSADLVHFPLEDDVALSNSPVFPVQKSERFLTLDDVRHDELPSNARRDTLLHDLGNVPRYDRHIDAHLHNLYKQQVDEGRRESPGYLPLESSSNLQQYKDINFCNQNSSPRMCNDGEYTCFSCGHSKQGVYGHCLCSSNYLLKPETTANLQEVGVTRERIISDRSHLYPSTTSEFEDGPSRVKYHCHGAMASSDTKPDSVMMLSDLSQEVDLDDGIWYSSNGEGIYNDAEWGMAHQVDYDNCPPTGRKNTRVQNSVFDRISNTPNVGEDLDENATLEEVQAWLAEHYPSWRKAQVRKPSVITYCKKQVGGSVLGKQPCRSAPVSDKQACNNALVREKQICNFVPGKRKTGGIALHENQKAGFIVTQYPLECSDAVTHEKQLFPFFPQERDMLSSTQVSPIQNSGSKSKVLPFNADAFQVQGFINFKRRREVGRDSSDTDITATVDSEVSEPMLSKVKRRQLVRPSFGIGFVNSSSTNQNGYSDDQKAVQDFMPNCTKGSDLMCTSVFMRNHSDIEDAKFLEGHKFLEHDIAGKAQVSNDLGSLSSQMQECDDTNCKITEARAVEQICTSQFESNVKLRDLEGTSCVRKSGLACNKISENDEIIIHSGLTEFEEGVNNSIILVIDHPPKQEASAETMSNSHANNSTHEDVIVKDQFGPSASHYPHPLNECLSKENPGTRKQQNENWSSDENFGSSKLLASEMSESDEYKKPSKCSVQGLRPSCACPEIYESCSCEWRDDLSEVGCEDAKEGLPLNSAERVSMTHQDSVAKCRYSMMLGMPCKNREGITICHDSIGVPDLLVGNADVINGVEAALFHECEKRSSVDLFVGNADADNRVEVAVCHECEKPSSVNLLVGNADVINGVEAAVCHEHEKLSSVVSEDATHISTECAKLENAS